MCQIYLTKGRGSGGKSTVDRFKSKCPNLVRFNYKNAAQSSEQSPCSNVPVICSLCPAGSPAVWTYSLHPHYRERHRLDSFSHFPTQIKLSQLEEDGMKCVWNTHFNQWGTYHKERRVHGHKPPLSISEAHRSRFLVS